MVALAGVDAGTPGVAAALALQEEVFPVVGWRGRDLLQPDSLARFRPPAVAAAPAGRGCRRFVAARHLGAFL